MDEQAFRALGGADDGVPDWWPYAAEFPRWYVWRGICSLVYATRARTNPPVVVRGEDAVDLRDEIVRAEGQWPDDHYTWLLRHGFAADRAALWVKPSNFSLKRP